MPRRTYPGSFHVGAQTAVGLSIVDRNRPLKPFPKVMTSSYPGLKGEFTRSNQATYLHPCRSSTFVTSSLKDFYAEAMPKNLPKLRNVAPTSIPDVKEHKEGSRRSTSTAGSGRIKLNDFRTWGQEIGKDAKRMHFPRQEHQKQVATITSVLEKPFTHNYLFLREVMPPGFP